MKIALIASGFALALAVPTVAHADHARGHQKHNNWSKGKGKKIGHGVPAPEAGLVGLPLLAAGGVYAKRRRRRKA